MRTAKYSNRKTGGTKKMMCASIQRLEFQRIQLDLRFCPWLLLFKNVYECTNELTQEGNSKSELNSTDRGEFRIEYCRIE